MHHLKTLLVLSLAASAAAQDSSYSLRPGSTMNREFCLPPCLCPYNQFNGPLSGSFTLSLIDVTPLYTRYRLSGIQWAANFPQGTESMNGSGIYTIGGEVALTHRLQLDLTIGPLTVITSFDSGFVPVDPNHPFPKFAIVATAEPTCRRDTLRIIAGPAGGACYANCDGSSAAPILTANDFQCFLNRFAAGESYANCDGSTANPVLTANDFQCFLDSFAAGCS